MLVVMLMCYTTYSRKYKERNKKKRLRDDADLEKESKQEIRWWELLESRTQPMDEFSLDTLSTRATPIKKSGCRCVVNRCARQCGRRKKGIPCGKNCKCKGECENQFNKTKNNNEKEKEKEKVVGE